MIDRDYLTCGPMHSVGGRLKISDIMLVNCTEVRFAIFFSGGFITAIVVNPPERKLAKRTYMHWVSYLVGQPNASLVNRPYLVKMLTVFNKVSLLVKKLQN